MSKSLAELGSQADQHERNLQLLRGKERVAEDTLNRIQNEITAELKMLEALQERATQAFAAILHPDAHGEETPPEPILSAPDGQPSAFNGASF